MSNNSDDICDCGIDESCSGCVCDCGHDGGPSIKEKIKFYIDEMRIKEHEKRIAEEHEWDILSGGILKDIDFLGLVDKGESGSITP